MGTIYQAQRQNGTGTYARLWKLGVAVFEVSGKGPATEPADELDLI